MVLNHEDRFGGKPARTGQILKEERPENRAGITDRRALSPLREPWKKLEKVD